MVLCVMKRPLTKKFIIISKNGEEGCGFLDGNFSFTINSSILVEGREFEDERKSIS